MKYRVCLQKYQARTELEPVTEKVVVYPGNQGERRYARIRTSKLEPRRILPRRGVLCMDVCQEEKRREMGRKSYPFCTATQEASNKTLEAFNWEMYSESAPTAALAEEIKAELGCTLQQSSAASATDDMVSDIVSRASTICIWKRSEVGKKFSSGKMMHKY